MIMDVPGVPNMVASINEELPPEIRLWGYVGLLPMLFYVLPYVGLLGSGTKLVQCPSVCFIPV
jgi:hypothetical protein